MALSQGEVKALIDLTTNPADRLWRYPACRPLLALALKLHLTPNQITIFHSVLGLGAGAVIAVGTPRAFFLAGVMFEVRSILDCLDGAVARATGASSPFGRALDQLGDTIGFLSLMGGGLVCMARLYGWAFAGIVIFLTMVVSAACTTAWDHFRQRFTSFLEKGYDSTEEDYLVLCRRFDEHRTAALWMSRQVSIYAWHTLSRQSLPRLRERVRTKDWPKEGEVHPPTALGLAIQDAAKRHDPELRGIMRRIAAVGGDNLILLLTLGLLSGHYLEAFPIVMTWGLVVWIYTVVTVNRYLGEEARDVARSQNGP
jgi:hypothetical protein